MPVSFLGYTSHMLQTLRTHARTLSAVAAAAFTALWFASFASACIAATCDLPDGKCAGGDVSMVAAPCEQATASCELPSFNTPLSHKLHFPLAPVVIGATPPAVAAVPIGENLPPDWRSTRPPNSPIYLTYLALLN